MKGSSKNTGSIKILLSIHHVHVYNVFYHKFFIYMATQCIQFLTMFLLISHSRSNANAVFIFVLSLLCLPHSLLTLFLFIFKRKKIRYSETKLSAIEVYLNYIKYT